MKNRIVLISKDALSTEYLPVYGNKYNKMPNLDELARKGTIFTRYYTAAPSSAMSYISMFTGKYPHQTDRRNYSPIQGKHNDLPNMYDNFAAKGYACHVLWDIRWYENAYIYSKCFGKSTIFHNMNIEQVAGCHNNSNNTLKNNETLSQESLKVIKDEIKSIANANEPKLFLWVHLPHVLKGRTGYGTDMDLFDDIIGYLRELFGDDSIFISSDHGNMNGWHNKITYGFDVYEPAIRIPLITPRIDGKEIYDTPTSNIRIAQILEENLPVDEFIYSDCAYYAQQTRKLAIIHGNYKYIYNKSTKSEELYDLRYDPTERCNIISKLVLDPDRKKIYKLDEAYFYPYWEESEKEREILHAEWKRIWKEGSKLENWEESIRKFLKKFSIVQKFTSIILDINKKRER